MSIFRRNSYSSSSFSVASIGTGPPVEIAVQVEVEVHDDDELEHVMGRRSGGGGVGRVGSPEIGNSSHGNSSGATAATAITATPTGAQRQLGSYFDELRSHNLWNPPTPTPTSSWLHSLLEQFSLFSSRRSNGYTEMSLPRADYDPRRVCLNPFPNVDLGRHRRTIGVYVAGGLFALANWIFLDAAILSKHAHVPWGDEPPVHVTFVDWVPGICSLLGYLIVNMIDKDRIKGEEGFGDSRAVWRARLFLFIGFAFMAGGLAGSVTVLVLKYLLSDYAEMFKYYGYANVSQNICLMLSAIVLWMAQSTSSEYEYNLTL